MYLIEITACIAAAVSAAILYTEYLKAHRAACRLQASLEYLQTGTWPKEW